MTKWEVQNSLKELIGEFTRQNGDFNSALENAGFSKRKTKKGAFFYGLKLKEGQDFL